MSNIMLAVIVSSALLMSGAVNPVKPVPTGLRDAGLTIPLPVVRLRTTAHP